jgi:hypothetical protein
MSVNQCTDASRTQREMSNTTRTITVHPYTVTFFKQQKRKSPVAYSATGLFLCNGGEIGIRTPSGVLVDRLGPVPTAFSLLALGVLRSMAALNLP